MTLLDSLPADHLPGANFPPEPIEDVAPEDKRIADLIANADQHATTHPIIEDEEAADAAANWKKQLTDHRAEYKAAFDKEKAPYETELARIRAKWHPRLERLDACLASIRPRLSAWMKLDTARKKAEREVADRAAAEAEHRAAQLAEQAQAKAGGPSTVTNAIMAMEAAQEAAQARKAAAAMPTRSQMRGSLGGPTLSLRTVWKAHIADQDAFYGHVRDHKDVKALFQSLANASARHGTRNPNLPGCEIYSTQE